MESSERDAHQSKHGCETYRIVEIELKGAAKAIQGSGARSRQGHPSGYKVEMDNPQVRIIRVTA